MYDVKSLLVDSGYIYDTSITGGRVGVYQFGQQTLWSNLKVQCLERQIKAMYFDGVDDYITLTNISTLNIYKRFVKVFFFFFKYIILPFIYINKCRDKIPHIFYLTTSGYIMDMIPELFHVFIHGIATCKHPG